VGNLWPVADTEKPPGGMLLEAVLGSEAIDTSGEELDVAGADISDLEEGLGQINFEHRGSADGKDKDAAPSGNDWVGRIVYAKKIFGPSDCENDRQRDFWRQIEMPFIYGIVRLYDAAGHPNARALAAIIRDHSANGEKILWRWSVEGNTLKTSKGGKRLDSTVIRNCALTLKPCNRTSETKVLADPQAPDGFPKRSVKLEPDFLERALARGEPELGARQLGAAVVLDYSPIADEGDLAKTLAAGSYDAAPGSLTSGAALQREDLGVRSWANRAKAALRDWDRTGKFSDFLKSRVPEASDEFVDRFADMVDTHRVARRDLLKREGDEGLSVQGRAVRAPRAEREASFDEERGILHTPRGSIPAYVPSRDPDKRSGEAFQNILDDPRVTAHHEKAVRNWARVNKKLRAGKLPPEVVMHATLFSQASPNTPVSLQEKMYSHLVDSMRSSGVDARSPEFGGLHDDWIGRDDPGELPEHSRGYFERIRPEITLGADSKVTDRKRGELYSYALADSKWRDMSRYHKLHDHMVDLVGRHRADTRSAVAEMMDHKRAARIHEEKRERLRRAGKPDSGPYDGPAIQGLAPKTARYAYSMMGGENAHVPDTHFVRHLFGLDKVKDGPTAEYLKKLLWYPTSGHVLEGIDRWYARNHDAVRHVRESPALRHLFQDDESAIFPAFWKHWLAVAPHEAARGQGMANLAFNQETTHEPYWEAIRPYLKKSEGGRADPAETAATHLAWARAFGEVPALRMYFEHLAPRLLGPDDGEEEFDPKSVVRKFEALGVELRKAVAQLSAPPRGRSAPAGDDPMGEIVFGGRRVRPGFGSVDGNRYLLLAAEPGRFIGVPATRARHWDASDLVSIPRTNGVHVAQDPEVLDEGTGVDPAKHGSELNRHPEQNALLEGLDFGKQLPGQPPHHADLGNTAAARSGWLPAARGPVFVKAAEPEEGDPFNESRREVAYHNLAKDFFGLGQYVPAVALVRHPRTGREHAVIEAVRGGHHHGEGGPDDRAAREATISRLAASGDLDKIFVMNSILGNADRHKYNYMFTPEEPGLKLIDHGYSFTAHSSPGAMPSYIAALHASKRPTEPEAGAFGKRSPEIDQQPMHPDAVSWVKSLDGAEFQKRLGENGVPEGETSQALYRLRNLQKHLEKHPNLSRKRVWRAPSLDSDEGAEYAHPNMAAEVESAKRQAAEQVPTEKTDG
jgi:hypothetical protein